MLSFSAFKRSPPREALLAVLAELGMGLSNTLGRFKIDELDSLLVAMDYMGKIGETNISVDRIQKLYT